MAADCGNINISPAEFDRRRDLLKESVNECISKRDFYIFKRKENEIKLKRLVHIKESLTFLKNILLQDLYKSHVNPGKDRKLLNKAIKEFQEKHCSMNLHLENLPGISQLRELVQSNEKLCIEYVTWTDKLDNMKKEYSQIILDLENDLKKKITEFSHEMNKQSAKMQ